MSGCRLLAHHDISLRCGIWPLSGQYRTSPAERPEDLWVHGLARVKSVEARGRRATGKLPARD